MSTISENAKAIFLEAVEKHAPENWPEFLDQACGDERDLRTRRGTASGPRGQGQLVRSR